MGTEMAQLLTRLIRLIESPSSAPLHGATQEGNMFDLHRNTPLETAKVIRVSVD